MRVRDVISLWVQKQPTKTIQPFDNKRVVAFQSADDDNIVVDDDNDDDYIDVDRSKLTHTRLYRHFKRRLGFCYSGFFFPVSSIEDRMGYFFLFVFEF